MNNNITVTYKEVWNGITITNNLTKATKDLGWIVANDNKEAGHSFKDLRLTKYEIKALIKIFQTIEKTLVIEAL